MSESTTSAVNPLAALQRFVKRRPDVERCELCSALLAPEHEHLIEPATRKLLCACQACALLFSGSQSVRYRRVPRRVKYLEDFQLSDAQWDDLHVPINLVFFFHSTPAERVLAIYPSPAGATESLLTLEAWRRLEDDNPALRAMEHDVEALLVNRVGTARDHYLVPIDRCYQLVGLIRKHWRGLSGGAEVWKASADFFAELRRH